MADNVAITEGSGVSVATDDVGGAHYQKVKLVWGVDGTATLVSTSDPVPVVQTGTHNIGTVTTVTTVAAVTAISNALPAGTNAIGKLAANSGVDIGDVDVTSISAGENHLGEVGGKSALKIITMSADTGALGSGDLTADTQQFDGFFRKTDGTGVINSITVTEKDAQGAAFYIIIHRTSTSMGTENSAPNISDANFVAGVQHIIAVATTDFVTVSGTKTATIRNLGLPVMAVSGTDDLYISILNSTGTPTYTSGEIQLGIGVMLD